MAESVWRTATAEGASIIRTDHAQKTFDLEGIDGHGLNRLDREYMTVLADADGPVRLNVIATRLGVPTQTLVKNVEPYLVRLGLVTKDDGGRRLTVEGMQHVRRAASQEGAPLEQRERMAADLMLGSAEQVVEPFVGEGDDGQVAAPQHNPLERGDVAASIRVRVGQAEGDLRFSNAVGGGKVGVQGQQLALPLLNRPSPRARARQSLHRFERGGRKLDRIKIKIGNVGGIVAHASDDKHQSVKLSDWVPSTTYACHLSGISVSFSR